MYRRLVEMLLGRPRESARVRGKRRQHAALGEWLERRDLLAPLTVGGRANIFGAGLSVQPAPGGGGGGTAPIPVNLAGLGNPGALTFPSVTGNVSGWAARGGFNPPDGGQFWGGVSNIHPWRGISGIVSNKANMFLVGVFLGPAGQPAAPPTTLNVSNANGQATFSPQLGQQFFIGDGKTDSGVYQRFNVPAGASTLYLGFAESFGFNNPNNLPGFYDDNGGFLKVEVAAAALPQNDIAVQDIPGNTASSATVLYSVKGAPGPFLVRVYRSSDRVLDAGDVLAGSATLMPSPNADATGVVPLSPVPTLNDYARPFLIAVADPGSPGNPGGVIPEVDEANNVFVVSKYASRRDVDKLGALSEQEESGGRGPGTISSGVGDPGGVSYGIYQFSSTRGVAQAFVNRYYPKEFAGLTPATKAFNDKWLSIAQSQPVAFRNAQHAYVKADSFDPTVASLRNGIGLTVGWRSNTLLDVVWSTAVHHGRGGAPSLIASAIRGLPQASTPDRIDDYTLIRAIYAERGRKDAGGRLVYFPGIYKTPATAKRVEASLVARFQREFKNATANLLAEV